MSTTQKEKKKYEQRVKRLEKIKNQILDEMKTTNNDYNLEHLSQAVFGIARIIS